MKARAANTYRGAKRNAAKRSADWKLARRERRAGRGFGLTISRAVAMNVETK
jgi:hypothetical protein